MSVAWLLPDSYYATEALGHRTALEYIEIFFRYLVKSSRHLSHEDYKTALEMLPEGGGKIMDTLVTYTFITATKNKKIFC